MSSGRLGHKLNRPSYLQLVNPFLGHLSLVIVRVKLTDFYVTYVIISYYVTIMIRPGSLLRQKLQISTYLGTDFY